MPNVLETSGEAVQVSTSSEQVAAELFDRYRDRLLRMIALRMDTRILGKVDSEDILQDAFVVSVRRIDGYLGRPSVPAFVWLRQLTSQVLIDTHRRYLGAQKRNARQEVTLNWGGCTGASSAFLAAELADSLTTPSQCAVREETVFALRAALERLPENDREVLVLRHLEELSNNEVAEVLGIDKCAASKRYLRALARLQEAMSAEA